MNQLDAFNKSQTKKKIPEFGPGWIVKVHQKIMEEGGGKKSKKAGERIQIFEGMVISKKGSKEPNATFTVRKESYGIGVERVFPLYSPLIEKIELVKKTKVRRAKLYYLRKLAGRKLRAKEVTGESNGNNENKIKKGKDKKEEILEKEEKTEESKKNKVDKKETQK